MKGRKRISQGKDQSVGRWGVRQTRVGERREGSNEKETPRPLLSSQRVGEGDRGEGTLCRTTDSRRQANSRELIAGEGGGGEGQRPQII